MTRQYRGTADTCSECGAPCRERSYGSQTCGDECAKARKHRLQRERREKARHDAKVSKAVAWYREDPRRCDPIERPWWMPWKR
jgi:hypothetical protein